MSKKRNAIITTREENFPEWYQEVIKSADLAESSPVRGCMVIKPNGYSIWENIQRVLDDKFKETGHMNAYFPLLIPLEFLQKEAEHVEGFAKECAVVTHHRLEANNDSELVPAGKIEPLIIRPTSETIIGHCYAKWVNSYRDLPILINQWCNVLRWEMRPRLFIRTAEFLWQEGHTAHETSEEAIEETLKMLKVYEDFAREYLAIPVITGEKTPDERFPGAVNTYTIEAMMQDKKSLQAGTSHFLGQNFAKASEIKFLGRDGSEHYAWTTSWGVSTRLIGAVIMAHGDDDGLVIPPRIAPFHVAILPVIRSNEDSAPVLEYCEVIAKKIRKIVYSNYGCLRCFVDKRELTGGERYWDAIKKGYPIRIEVGKKEIEENTVYMSTREKNSKEKASIGGEQFLEEITKILDRIHEHIYEKSLNFRDSNIVFIDNLYDFKEYFKQENPGFARVPWSDGEEAQAVMLPLLSELKISARCIEDELTFGVSQSCIFSSKTTDKCVIFARSY